MVMMIIIEELKLSCALMVQHDLSGFPTISEVPMEFCNQKPSSHVRKEERGEDVGNRWCGVSLYITYNYTQYLSSHHPLTLSSHHNRPPEVES